MYKNQQRPSHRVTGTISDDVAAQLTKYLDKFGIAEALFVRIAVINQLDKEPFPIPEMAKVTRQGPRPRKDQNAGTVKKAKRGSGNRRRSKN